MPARNYQDLIPSSNRDKPKFTEMVNLVAGAFGQIYDSSMQMVEAFSIDSAVGVQLDAVGLWVGLSRHQRVPIPNSFFTFNDPLKGWNLGSWKGPYEAVEGITTLDDDTYRATLKARVGANYWDGTYEGLNEIGSSALTDFGIQCFVIDNMDMSINIYIMGTPSIVLFEMIKRNIVPKAAGVRVSSFTVASPTGDPLFALSVETTEFTAGLDFGSFGNYP